MVIILLIVFYSSSSLACMPTDTPANHQNFFTPQTTLPYCTTTPTPPCPSGWVEYNAYCYLYEPTPAYTSTAVNNCIDLDADLVSIHSLAENNFVQTGNVAIFIGAHRAGTGNTDDNFVNFDGTPFSYSNWDSPTYPNNAGSYQYCVEMEAGTGKWRDVNCISTPGGLQLPYVCKMPVA